MITDKMIQDCWYDFLQLSTKDPNIVQRDSIPILWFGDILAYEKSKKKVVTIALNPSNIEFKDANSTGVDVRFKTAQGIANNLSLQPADINVYRNAMNRYFEENPYTKWFNHFERVLNTLGASYFKKCEISNTAIHIDIFSPVATAKKWGSLTGREKDRVSSANSISLHDMLRALAPDLIIVSLSQSVVAESFITEKMQPCSIQNITKEFCDGKRGYIRVFNLEKGVKLIAGRNMRGTPFGGMSNDFIIKSLIQL